MKILPISSYKSVQKTPSFGVNLASPLLTYQLEDFFVNINGYGKDMRWASFVRTTANQAVKLIRENAPFESVLHHIADGANFANRHVLRPEAEQAKLTGVLRWKRDSWNEYKVPRDADLYTPYGFCGNSKYDIYKIKLDSKVAEPLKNPYSKISLSTPILVNDANQPPMNYIQHGNAMQINSSLMYVEKMYNEIQKNYIKKEVKDKDLKRVNALIARSRWILAHSTPWCRGSDSIANIYIRALYKAMGIKAYPLIKDVSLDMEAYCTPLEMCIKNFPEYFEHPPIIAE